ncbi:uncharacterized protein LOC133840056 [Drosophila sulfurigaster albostrigata]|uniref:uncharacterized protein LOC133840056 n=1 Tax=Drosophila sulfurigaster albostrigata TaxID=89887 RepID=UPI002D21E63F|nr:uncharacterized protein LOC133840056 [Drosophila sulfurigaster albostrigata]
MQLKLVLLLATFGLAKVSAEMRYDNYKVYKVNIENMQQFDLLNAKEKALQFSSWREARHLGDSSDIMLPPQTQQAFEHLLNSQNFNYSLKIDNVQTLIDAQRPKQRTGYMEWTQYHTLDEIYAWLDVLEERYSDIVTPFTIGNSYEGRPIRGIKISYKEGNPAVFIESNIHAREWITSATITYFIDELLVPGKPGTKDIAKNVDWYIIPVLNVDGFVYSHESVRLWRKSRFPSDPSLTGYCIGTDLNRNFNYRWMLIGASDNPCAETYAGPSAESDLEISQLTSYIDNQIPDGTIKIYISLHSYGQYVLSPWGHTAEEFPEHYPQMMAVAKGFADALVRRYGTVFTYGSSATTLYEVSGSGKEWAYGVKNITIPYTIELRDKGDLGFLLPPTDILPVAREVTEGFVGMIAAAREIGSAKQLAKLNTKKHDSLVLAIQLTGRMQLKLVLLLATFGLAKVSAEMRYDNYKVYKVNIENMQQFELLNAKEKALQFSSWREARHLGDSSDIMLPPQTQQAFEQLLNSQNFNYTLKIDNVQTLIDAQRPKQRTGYMEWTQYHTLDEIYAWLDVLEERYSDIVTPFTIGNSYEGRPIRGIKISYKEGNPAVFIESNIHAREWITSATITYFIDELLVPGKPGTKDIAKNVDWYIIPVLNVDGFVYSHEAVRLWRKSRFPSDPSLTGDCIGTDLNRNFDYRWMLIGASDDPCSEFYAGPSAESDLEISQLTSYIDNHIPDGTIKIYISLHSYGQYVLSPWGHTAEEFPEHYPQMMAVAKGFADALVRRYGTVFTYGSSATTLYEVSGSGKEWAYGVKNITIPYTIELRDKGDLGFLLPPTDIIPVAREVTEGFVGMIAAAREIGVL